MVYYFNKQNGLFFRNGQEDGGMDNQDILRLTKLNQTYSSDSTVTAQLDVIIEDVNELIKNNNYNKDDNTGRRATRMASSAGKNS